MSQHQSSKIKNVKLASLQKNMKGLRKMELSCIPVDGKQECGVEEKSTNASPNPNLKNSFKFNKTINAGFKDSPNFFERTKVKECVDSYQKKIGGNRDLSPFSAERQNLNRLEKSLMETADILDDFIEDTIDQMEAEDFDKRMKAQSLSKLKTNAMERYILNEDEYNAFKNNYYTKSINEKCKNIVSSSMEDQKDMMMRMDFNFKELIKLSQPQHDIVAQSTITRQERDVINRGSKGTVKKNYLTRKYHYNDER